MRVALYARVSTKDGRQDNDNQLQALREFCAANSYLIYKEYVDAESGGTAKRPAFQQMFADAEAHRFDLLLFWSLDRLSREGAGPTLNHLQRLTDAGINWRSHTEAYLDSCGIFKDAVLAILAVIAKQERIRRSERALAAVAKKRRRGDTDFGRKPRVWDRQVARDMSDAGVPLRVIAARVGVSAMTVHRVLRKEVA